MLTIDYRARGVHRILTAICLLGGLALRGASAPAQEPTGSDEPQTRSPADMSVAERRAMMGKVNDYNRCVYNKAMEHIDDSVDIRQIADQALGACDTTLDQLSEQIAQFGFEARFGQLFVHRTRQRAVRMLLPELAVRKGR